jgi:PHD/YefM family antitoxin component YafN of YafNO toxin-antitoxin module
VKKTRKSLSLLEMGGPRLFFSSADEYEGWRETRAILRNRSLMKEIRQGLRQLEKGRRFIFEEVFGEPLRPGKRRK